MTYKITYYTNNRLNIKKTVLSHAQFYLEDYRDRLINKLATK